MWARGANSRGKRATGPVLPVAFLTILSRQIMETGGLANPSTANGKGSERAGQKTLAGFRFFFPGEGPQAGQRFQAMFCRARLPRS